MFIPFLTSLLFCSTLAFTSAKPVYLDTNNTLLLRGEVNEKMATDFVFDLNSRKKKSDLYVFLDTNGGSVDAGNKIVNEIQKHNLTCIAQKAISMGFVILQSCEKRYVTPLSTLMQHQISYGVSDEKAKIESYVEFIKQIGEELTEMQANKIGITSRDFKLNTYNDWWLFGKKSIQENCADEMVDVYCTPKLTNQTYVLDNGMYSYVYSKCPLVTNYIEKTKNKKNEDDFFYFL